MDGSPTQQGRRNSGGGGPPIGLLSPANADLYRRFEVEEAKTNHLRVKEQQQSDALSEFSRRLEDINQSLVDEESSCGRRTTEIKEELDRLDREEASLDVQLKQRKKVLQTMTSAVADIKVQLAYNFTTLPKSKPFPQQGGVRCAAEPMFDVAQFAETLSDSEVADIVGESYYVDEQGTRHRVIFSEPNEDALGDSGSNASSPQRASSVSRKSGGGGARSKRGDRGTSSVVTARGSWLNSTVSKRATYLLLSSARQAASDRVEDVENCGARGGYGLESEYFADLSAAKAQLATIHKAIRSLLLTTPTSSSLGVLSDNSSLNFSASGAILYEQTAVVSSPSRRSGGVTLRQPPNSNAQQMSEEQLEAHHVAVASALPTQAVMSREFEVAFTRQREQLAQLRYALQQDEKLLEVRKGMAPAAWVAAVQSSDNDTFQKSRVELLPQQNSSATGNTIDAEVRPPSTSRLSPPATQKSVKIAAPPPKGVQSAGRSDAAPRPTSAPSMSRFASAATRSFEAQHHNNLPRARIYEARYLQPATNTTSGVTSSLQPHAPEYRFRSHSGLQQAVEQRGEAARRERLRQRRQYDDAGDDGTASSRHHTE